MQPTLAAAGRKAPRVGNLGHVTRIANKITQLGNIDSCIQTHIQVQQTSSYFWKDWLLVFVLFLMQILILKVGILIRKIANGMSG